MSTPSSEDREKAVIRFRDGRVVKGFLLAFSPETDHVSLEGEGKGGVQTVRIDDLKAIFFVKSFAGNREYHEHRSFGSGRRKGQRIFVRFTDGEHLVGFLEGGVPWEKGFFLSRREGEGKGFFVFPADSGSNNERVFVVSSSVADVTVVP